MTSHDVVARARRLLGERRIGHGGTLDPDATGVLVLGVGGGTRLLRFVADLPKAYTGELVLGVETSTLDDSGEVTAVHDMSSVMPEAVAEAARALTGHLMQVPPMVSALHSGGRRLHELAREGVTVERAARPVEVRRFEVEPAGEPGVWRIEVECSSGTYVRSLAADLGAALGGGAHLRRLRRTAVGPFGGCATRLVALERLSPAEVGPAGQLVAHLAQVTASGELAAAVGHGAVLARDTLGVVGTGPWSVVEAETGRVLAVYGPDGDGRVKPVLVMAPERGSAGAPQ
jgi:tRNA pseudouridine55 synthase